MFYRIIDSSGSKLVSYNINNYVIGNVVVGVNSRVTIGEHVSVVVVPWTVPKFQCYHGYCRFSCQLMSSQGRNPVSVQILMPGSLSMSLLTSRSSCHCKCFSASVIANFTMKTNVKVAIKSTSMSLSRSRSVSGQRTCQGQGQCKVNVFVKSTTMSVCHCQGRSKCQGQHQTKATHSST